MVHSLTLIRGLASAALICMAYRTVPEGALETHAPLRGVTIRGDTVPLRADSGRLYTILYGPYSCADCYVRLDSALHAITRDDPEARLLVLARVGSSIMTRRAALADIRRLIPSGPPVLFEPTDPAVEDPWPPVNLQGGVFGRYGVTRTPALVIMEPHDSIRYVPYGELFTGAPGTSTESRLDQVLGTIERR